MDLRDDARAILAAAVAAVEPRRAVRDALSGAAAPPLRGARRIVVVGAGKAAPGMALAALDALGQRLAGGILTTKDGHALPVPGIEVLEAAHPVPDARGQAGAERALALASEAEADDLVLCLLSGGASALWPAPVAGVTLADLRAVTDGLLRAGAPIGELNAVRKHLSRIAGGGLARAARPARVLTLAISDVIGSPPDVIGSGPTVPDPTTYADALAVLARRGVVPPAAVLAHLRAGAAELRPETPKPGDPALERTAYRVVASNPDALRGAEAEARRLGYGTLILTARLEGEAREVGVVAAGLAAGIREEGFPLTPPAAVLLGGETTVRVTGDGRGGRNQELALATAAALDGVPGVLVASLGTDGTDGPTDAAGGMVDGGTVRRGVAAGLDARDYLERNDAYAYLEATGDLVVTGPTGTNVNDVVLLLAG